MQIIANLEGPLRGQIPHEISRLWPKMTIYGSLIYFCEEGDYVSREEAITALEWMLEQLKGDY